MSYSWDKYMVAYEEDGRAVVTDSIAQYSTAFREYSRMKANEIVFPERYRGIRLLRQTTSVQCMDISP